ncbi:DUF7109 family protein [Halobellus clavatus]|uniref:Uncharacterized protein n=1 Tax=Halobellus clavatus TaxID=660517 RepID=A0A1H3CTE4_9EURY|nr:hypothetical protein [Halobellus clavatus]SDX56824.1 hypothetical protein SAMN04487946_101162 [Halobellus clavatus]
MTAAADPPFDPDELAGIVDLFGALTPAELERALSELAFKRGTDLADDAVAAAVDEAVRSYALVRYARDAAAAADGDPARDATAAEDGPGDRTLLAPGPAAFPTLPPNAEDLPHILAVDSRDVDRETAAEALAERFRADAARAASAGDDAEIRRLLDLTYDVAVWAESIDIDDVRDRLDAALDDGPRA